MTADLIETGLALRATVIDRGFKTLHEYYKACDKLAEASPLGLLKDTPEYEVWVEEEEKIARSFDGAKSGPTWTVKKLKFKRKPTTGGR